MPYQGLPGLRAGERRGRGSWREEGTVSAPQFSCHQHVCRCTMLTALWLLRVPAGSWSRSRSRNVWKRRYHHRMREIPTRSQSQIRWRLDLSAHRQTELQIARRLFRRSCGVQWRGPTNAQLGSLGYTCLLRTFTAPPAAPSPRDTPGRSSPAPHPASPAPLLPPT